MASDWGEPVTQEPPPLLAVPLKLATALVTERCVTQTMSFSAIPPSQTVNVESRTIAFQNCP
jgi:hypothetical protein